MILMSEFAEHSNFNVKSSNPLNLPEKVLLRFEVVFSKKYCFDLHGVWSIGKRELNTSKITPSKFRQKGICGL